MEKLLPLAEKIAASLIARKETIAVAESSTGGLISAALLAVPGASAYYRGGGVIYTPRARAALVNITKEEMEAIGNRGATEPYATLLANRPRTAQHHMGPERNRRDRALGQSLRRCRRTFVHGRCRTANARDHARDRKRRSCCEHARLRTSCAGIVRGNDRRCALN